MNNDCSGIILTKVQIAFPDHTIDLEKKVVGNDWRARFVIDGVKRSTSFDIDAANNLIECHGIEGGKSLAASMILALQNELNDTH